MRGTPYFSTHLHALRIGLVCRLSTPLARRYLICHPNRFNVLMLWALLPEHRAWCEWTLRFYIRFILGPFDCPRKQRRLGVCFSLFYFPVYTRHWGSGSAKGKAKFYECFQVMES